MKNAIIYTRVSSREQVDEGSSLETQKRACYEYAEKNDFKVLHHFEEEGESAKTTQRTQLQKMIEYAVRHKDEIDALIIYSVNRLSRVTNDYLSLKYFFNKQGAIVESVTEPLSDDPTGRFLETVLAASGQMDNEIKAIRSKVGMEDGIRSGRWMWMAPLGFVNARLEGKKNIIPDPDVAYTDALKLSWELIADGRTMEEARKIVNITLRDIGRKPIQIQTFSRMLKNKIYIGVVCGFGLEIQSPSIKPFIKPELFEEVQLALSGNRNRGNKYLKTNPDYPLRGILLCKEGHKMTASSPRGRSGKRYPKYHCTKCRGKGSNFNTVEIDGRFLDYVGAMSMQGDIRAALKEAIRLNLTTSQKQNEDARNKLDKRSIAIKAEKKELSLKNIKGIVPDATAQEILADYEAEELDIRLQLNNLENTQDDAEDLVEFGLEKLSNLAQTFEAITDVSVRARFQKWLFPAGLAYDGETFGTTAVPLIYRLKQSTLVGALPNYSHVVIPRGIEPRLPG